MTATLVHVWVKPENIGEFIEATYENHCHSVKEDGNLSFDILQDTEDPCKFTLYEAYDNEASAAAHKNTSHYLQWRDRVKDWMARPREGVKHKILYPQKIS